MEINQNDILGQELARLSGTELLSQQEINEARQNFIAQSETAEPEVGETNPTEQPTAPSQPNEDDEETVQLKTLFEKKTGKKYEDVTPLLSRKSFDDEVVDRFGKPLNEIEETIKNPKVIESELPTELLKKQLKYIKDGGTEKDFIQSLLMQERVAEMSHEELIKIDLKTKYPNADKAKIDILYRAEYKAPKPLDAESYSEQEVAERNEEIEAFNVRQEIKAEEIRAKITEQAVKAMEAPLQKPLTKEQLADIERRKEQGTKQAKQVFDALEKYNALEIDVVEKDEKTGKDVVSKLSYKPTKEQLEQVNYILQNPYENFYKSFVDKDGNVDAQGLIDAVTIRVVGKSAIQEMAKDFKHEGKKEFIKKELKNADFTVGEITKPTTAQKKRTEELIGHLMG
jgi:hypothetical protein